jgi:hypothetical protein
MTQRKDYEPRIPTKVLIAGLLGAIGFGGSLLVDDTKLRVVFGLSVSLFIAGIAFVVQFLYEVEKRLEQMEDAYTEQAIVTNKRITDGFKNVNAATELFGLVEESPLKTDVMTQLVRNSVRIEPSPTLLFEFAQSEITRLSEMLKLLSDGADVTYEGEDRDWMLGLTKATMKTIDATSLNTVDAGAHGFNDGGLWASELGQRYLDTQGEAIRRGVIIRRLFIMDRPELIDDPDFRGVCDLHRQTGIKVRILDPSSMPNSGSLFDFVVFDGVLSYQARPGSRVGNRGRPVIVSTQLITRPQVVALRIQRFAALWEAATD